MGSGERLPWSRAWARAAYGDGGFWTRVPQPPARHFRTSAHVGDALAQALVVLLAEVDDRLRHPPVLDVVDVGAGDGELLSAVLRRCPDDLLPRLRPTAVDLRPRPPSLDERVTWVRGAAPDALPDAVSGLLLAHEWLDEVPLDVVQVDDGGDLRLVLVDEHGGESLGPRLPTTGADAAATARWVAAWWPVSSPGDRAEPGLTRDAAWAACVRRLVAGTALAIDYGHVRERRPPGGTLTAYLDGRQVAPVPDGAVNLTAHVALDSVAHAVGGTVRTQRDVLLDLGLRAPLPDRALAGTDPSAYADALVAASQVSELVDVAGLGGFGWVRVDR